MNTFHHHRIYAFIDSQNLNLAIRDQGWRLDFVRFRKYLADKYGVRKTFVFMGYMTEHERLYEHLRNAGFSIVFKPVVEHNGVIKGNVDAELVLHAAAIEFENYDKAIIATGDGDFFCLIEYLLSKQKLLHVLIPNPKKYSSLLRPFRKYFMYINTLGEKLGKQKSERE